jgi:hypothetical protein
MNMRRALFGLVLLTGIAAAQEKVAVEQISETALAQAWADDHSQDASQAQEPKLEDATKEGSAQKQLPNAPSSQKKSKHSGKDSDKYELVLLNVDNWTPLTKYQKFRLFTDDLISPGTHLSIAGAAWLSWSTNDQSYMGPGFEGWAKRYGYSVADEALGQFVGAFALPVIFKQDPRYLPWDQGTKKRRMLYAMSRVLITRNDAGGESFNVSKVGGTFMVSSLSNLYYPSGRDSSAGATLSRAGLSLASDAGYNIFIEFWPDVARKFHLGKFFQQIVRRSIQVNRTVY